MVERRHRAPRVMYRSTSAAGVKCLDFLENGLIFSKNFRLRRANNTNTIRILLHLIDIVVSKLFPLSFSHSLYQLVVLDLRLHGMSRMG